MQQRTGQRDLGHDFELNSLNGFDLGQIHFELVHRTPLKQLASGAARPGVQVDVFGFSVVGPGERVATGPDHLDGHG